MIILNFSHPLADHQKAQIETITGQTIGRLVEHLPHFERSEPLSTQVQTLVEQCPLTSKEWQTQMILINPPGLATAASTLLALLHGRMGYFPATIFIRPVPDAVPVRYEVAEIMNLQELRDQSRAQRNRSSGGQG